MANSTSGNSPMHVHSELSRDMTLFHVTMMGLGMMIGAGVFVGIGLCMGQVGTGGLMVTFTLNGLIAMFSAMSFAELASAIPRAGGTYNFARIGFGRPASFIAGWMEWLAASAAGGLYAIVLSTYTVAFLYGLGWMNWCPISQEWVDLIFRIIAISFFVLINFRGSSETGKLGAVFTVAQMLFVVGIGVVGLITWFFHPERIENYQPFLGDATWIKLLGTMGVIYVAFEGFEVIAQAGDETVDPRRNIPKAILYSVFFVTLTYLLVAFATVVAIPKGADLLGGQPLHQWIFTQGHHGDMGFSEAVGFLIPGWGKLLVTLAVIFSATSALNATVYSATRSSYALGRDRMLPKFFAKIHPKTKTPYIALAFSSFLVFSIGLTLSSVAGAATASVLFLVLFLLVNLCVIRIRRTMGDELEYGYLMPLFPLFPILAIVIQLGMAGGILEESPIAIYIALGWLAAGCGVYYFYSRHRTIATEDEIHVFHEEPAQQVEPGKSRVMVAIANPKSALQLVETTHKICCAKDASVELIHMVPVPQQVPLEDAEQYMYEGKESICETMLSLSLHFPISTTLRYCRNAARGIVSAATEKKVDLLIMGWHGQVRKSHFTLGSTVDPIMERTACPVAMFKNCGGGRKFKKVFVPVAGGPNSAFALEMATMLADEDGEVTVFTCVTKEGKQKYKKFDLKAFVNNNIARCHIPRERIHCKTVTTDDVKDEILTRGQESDLVVLGSTLDSWLKRHSHVPMPEQVAMELDTSVVMVRAAKGIKHKLREKKRTNGDG